MWYWCWKGTTTCWGSGREGREFRETSEPSYPSTLPSVGGSASLPKCVRRAGAQVLDHSLAEGLQAGANALCIGRSSVPRTRSADIDSRRYGDGNASITAAPLIRSLLVEGLWTSAESRHNLNIDDLTAVLSAAVCRFPPAWLSTWLSKYRT